MKKIFYSMLAAFAFVALASCERNNVEGPEQTPVLEVVSNATYFPAAGGQGSIVVETSDALTAESSKSWLTVSVSGNTVNLTAAPNQSLESRYAEVRLKAGKAEAKIVAEQFGFASVSFTASDIVASSAAQTHSFIYSYESDMVVSTEADWITPSVATENGQQVVKIELAENGTGAVRTGEVNWTLGMEEGVINVKQFPNFAVNEAWTLQYVGDEGVNSILDVEGVEGRFLVDVMPQALFKSKYDGSFETYAFDVAMAVAHPFDACGELPWDLLAVGTYEAILVGVDENNDPTGEYNYYEFEVTRENEKSAYEKWLGKWEITYVEYEYDDEGYKTGEKNVTHTWEIKQKEADASFTISGVSSTKNEFGDVVASFDAATGALSVIPQLTLETTYQGNPDLYYFCGLYATNRLVYQSESPIFTATISGTEATLTPGQASSGDTFTSASTLNQYNNSWYPTTGHYALPGTMKKVEDGEGGGGGDGGDDGGDDDPKGIQQFAGTWSFTSGGADYDVTASVSGTTKVSFTFPEEFYDYVVEASYDEASNSLTFGYQEVDSWTHDSFGPILDYLAGLVNDSQYGIVPVTSSGTYPITKVTVSSDGKSLNFAGGESISLSGGDAELVGMSFYGFIQEGQYAGYFFDYFGEDEEEGLPDRHFYFPTSWTKKGAAAPAHLPGTFIAAKKPVAAASHAGKTNVSKRAVTPLRSR